MLWNLLQQAKMRGWLSYELEIPKDAADPLDRERIEAIDGRWLGLWKEDVVSCGRRAALEETPGVVLLAVEPEKADIIARSIGMVNHLIIDRRLAEALIDLGL